MIFSWKKTIHPRIGWQICRKPFFSTGHKPMDFHRFPVDFPNKTHVSGHHRHKTHQSDGHLDLCSSIRHGVATDSKRRRKLSRTEPLNWLRQRGSCGCGYNAENQKNKHVESSPGYRCTSINTYINIYITIYVYYYIYIFHITKYIYILLYIYINMCVCV